MSEIDNSGLRCDCPKQCQRHERKLTSDIFHGRGNTPAPEQGETWKERAYAEKARAGNAQQSLQAANDRADKAEREKEGALIAQLGDQRARINAEAKLSTAIAERDELKELLGEVGKLNDDYPYCPICNAFNHVHEPDCKLHKALKGDGETEGECEHDYIVKRHDGTCPKCTPEPGRWISVDDRLPDGDGEVEIRTRAFYSKFSEQFLRAGQFITEWRPLPPKDGRA